MPEVAYTTDVDRSLPPLRGWREGLRVMIDNLLVNATTHGRPASGRSCVHVEVARVDGGIRLAVGDNGPGIAGEERSAVLERFHRGRSAVGTGSGLGLALVRQQAELHSGALAVGQSALGGAEIEITLPLGLA
jgi:two-component system sensor histidine kinase PrrB